MNQKSDKPHISGIPFPKQEETSQASSRAKRVRSPLPVSKRDSQPQTDNYTISRSGLIEVTEYSCTNPGCSWEGDITEEGCCPDCGSNVHKI